MSKTPLAGTAADVEHPHPADDPGGAKEASRDQINEMRLLIQAVELPIGMAENVRAAWPLAVSEAFQLSSIS